MTEPSASKNANTKSAAKLMVAGILTISLLITGAALMLRSSNEVVESPDAMELPALNARFEALVGKLEKTSEPEEITTIRKGWEAMNGGSSNPEVSEAQKEYLRSVIRLLEMAVDPGKF